jgi:KaiC/GvpD/RAD55 family RecA-like ATPase
MDTWIQLRNTPGSADARRLVVVKARGMAHAAEERRFKITDSGVRSN